MRVSLSTYGSHGDVEPMVGFAVQAEALGAAIKKWDGPAATGVMRPGGWR